MIVNQKQLANALGITDRRVRQLRDEEGIFSYDIDIEGKKYDLEKCVQEYIDYKLSRGNHTRGIRGKSNEC